MNDSVSQEDVGNETDEDNHDEIGGLFDENIIHTTILHKRTELSEFDLVVILTSKRIVVTEYHRKNFGTYIKKKWESTLKHLLPPEIKNAESGSAISLILKKALEPAKPGPIRRRSMLLSGFQSRPPAPINESPEQANATDSVFAIQGNYMADYLITNLYFCINTVLGISENILFSAENFQAECFEDGEGFRHIGPWQFSSSHRNNLRRNSEEDESVIHGAELRHEVLVLEPWGYEMDSSNFVPTSEDSLSREWLQNEETESITCQNQLREIYENLKYFSETIKKLPQSKRSSLDAQLNSFKEGKITYAELQKCYLDTTQKYLKEIDHDDGNSVQTTDNQQAGKRRSSLIEGMRKLTFNPFSSLTRRGSVIKDKSEPTSSVFSSISGLSFKALSSTIGLGDDDDKSAVNSVASELRELNEDRRQKKAETSPPHVPPIITHYPFSSEKARAADVMVKEALSADDDDADFSASNKARGKRESSIFMNLSPFKRGTPSPVPSPVPPLSDNLSQKSGPPTASKAMQKSSMAQLFGEFDSNANASTDSVSPLEGVSKFVNLSLDQSAVSTVPSRADEEDYRDVDPYDLFPSYDNFEVSVNSKGEVHERKFTEPSVAANLKAYSFEDVSNDNTSSSQRRRSSPAYLPSGMKTPPRKRAKSS